VTSTHLKVLGSTLFALALGCSDGVDEPSRLSTSSARGIDGVEPRQDTLTRLACEHGDVRECTRVISVQGDVVSCVRAVQYCVEGLWTECGANTPDEFLPDAGSANRRDDEAPGHAGAAGAPPSVR
jgi:hypothetical protein